MSETEKKSSNISSKESVDRLLAVSVQTMQLMAAFSEMEKEALYYSKEMAKRKFSDEKMILVSAHMAAMSVAVVGSLHLKDSLLNRPEAKKLLKDKLIDSVSSAFEIYSNVDYSKEVKE